MPALVLQLARCLLGGSHPAGWAQTTAPTRIQLGVRDMLKFTFMLESLASGGVVQCGLQNGGWRTKRWRKWGGATHQKCFHSASHHLAAVLQNIYFGCCSISWNLILWSHSASLHHHWFSNFHPILFWCKNLDLTWSPVQYLPRARVEK